MNQIEYDEIRKLPEKYKPLTAWGYFWYSILFMIPLVGFICLIVFACDGSNINRRSFARSYFCVAITVIVIFLIFFFTGAFGIIMKDLQK